MNMSRILVALSVLVLAGGAAGQIGTGPCFGDDGFNVGCCNTPTPNLPAFPAVTSSAVYACLLNCALEASTNVSMSLTAPNFVLCDIAVMTLTVTSSSITGPTFGGLVVAKYSRTWREVDSNGQQRQVWRFLLNGDVTYSPTAIGTTAACPIPTCAQGPNGLPVHLVGSIDYAQDCAPSTVNMPWQIALNLTHFTGCINHHAFSERPLVGAPAHVDRNYVLVAPSNFVFGPVAEPSGPLLAESVRSAGLSSAFPGYQCHGEATVANFGSITTNSTACYGCTAIVPANPPAIWRHQSIGGGVGCGPLAVIFPFNTVNIPGIFPTGMVTMSLGSYVGINPNQFPVGKNVSTSYGVMFYQDNCEPNDFPYHVVTGVGTTGGDPATLFNNTPTLTPLFEFLDLQTSEVPSGGTFGPGFGRLFLPRKVFNLNTP